MIRVGGTTVGFCWCRRGSSSGLAQSASGSPQSPTIIILMQVTGRCVGNRNAL